MSSFDLRAECPSDKLAIRGLTVSAFDSTEFGHQGEADLVEQLRAGCSDCLSWVAISKQGEVVGHLLFSPVHLRPANIEPKESDAAVWATGMGLAPMSVRPDWQRRGVGSSLVRYGLTQLEQQGCPFVVVLGHPEYYVRFGFQLAAATGVRHGFAGIPQDFFFIKGLTDRQRAPGNLHAFYRTEFGPQHGSA